MSQQPLAQVLGATQARAIQEALKPLLRAVGVRTIEERIGKPPRFLANARQRGSLRLADFLAVCSLLDLDPGDFVKTALAGAIPAEIRPPRIIAAARRRIHKPGSGIGEERLSTLQTAMQEEPHNAKAVLARALGHASPAEIPTLLGLYGSALRILSDLDRAELVFKEAREIARELDVPAAEPDLLLRMAYLALERDQQGKAFAYANEATVGHASYGNREGQGRGFQALGMFRYYACEYQHALRDFDAALRFLDGYPALQLAAHQVAALCYASVGAHDQAQERASEARALVGSAPVWMRGKVSWLEARLAQGSARLDHLRTAKRILCPGRPVDCALLTVELIEAGLEIGSGESIEQDVLDLCSLLEKSGNPTVEKAIVSLVRNQTMLTTRLIAQIRRSLDKTRDRRLSTLVSADLSC